MGEPGPGRGGNRGVPTPSAPSSLSLTPQGWVAPPASRGLLHDSQRGWWSQPPPRARAAVQLPARGPRGLPRTPATPLPVTMCCRFAAARARECKSPRALQSGAAAINAGRGAAERAGALRRRPRLRRALNCSINDSACPEGSSHELIALRPRSEPPRCKPAAPRALGAAEEGEERPPSRSAAGWGTGSPRCLCPSPKSCHTFSRLCFYFPP